MSDLALLRSPAIAKQRYDDAKAAKERTCREHFAKSEWCARCRQKTSVNQCTSQQHFYITATQRQLDAHAAAKEAAANPSGGGRKRRSAAPPARQLQAALAFDELDSDDESGYCGGGGAAAPQPASSSWPRKRKLAATRRGRNSDDPAAKRDADFISLEEQLAEFQERAANAERENAALRAAASSSKASSKAAAEKLKAKHKELRAAQMQVVYFKDRSGNKNLVTLRTAKATLEGELRDAASLNFKLRLEAVRNRRSSETSWRSTAVGCGLSLRSSRSCTPSSSSSAPVTQRAWRQSSATFCATSTRDRVEQGRVSMGSSDGARE
jgi:hypothetical protein